MYFAHEGINDNVWKEGDFIVHVMPEHIFNNKKTYSDWIVD